MSNDKFTTVWGVPMDEARDRLEDYDRLKEVNAELVGALEKMCGLTDMIGRSRFHYAAEYGRFATACVESRSALAKTKGEGK